MVLLVPELGSRREHVPKNAAYLQPVPRPPLRQGLPQLVVVRSWSYGRHSVAVAGPSTGRHAEPHEPAPTIIVLHSIVGSGVDDLFG